MIAQVIGWKFNDQAGMSTRGNEITTFPNGIPSQADQDMWTAEYNEFTTLNAYKALRQVEYSKRNQEEMRYDDAKNGTNFWIEWIDKIKLDIPKGSL